jgi:hypothetical protein
MPRFPVTPPPPARRWFRLALPAWLVLAAAQAFALSGFGQGPAGFGALREARWSEAVAWSMAVHRSAAQAILGGERLAEVTPAEATPPAASGVPKAAPAPIILKADVLP